MRAENTETDVWMKDKWYKTPDTDLIISRFLINATLSSIYLSRPTTISVPISTYRDAVHPSIRDTILRITSIYTNLGSGYHRRARFVQHYFIVFLILLVLRDFYG